MTLGREGMFQRIEHLAAAQMHHDYLIHCQVRQSVSRFHFDVAYSILTSAHTDEYELEQVLTAVLLLEQGLSIHDDVDHTDDIQQPLYVLAGDFDSSKYYYILAKLNRSRLIHVLCEAVAVINEAKMKIALQSDLSIPEYMWLMETAHGQLLHALAVHYLGDDGVWFSHIQSLVQAHIVEREVSRQDKSYLTPEQASEWLSRSLQRMASVSPSDIVSPLYSFAVEYFRPLQRVVEDLQLAEGNH